MIIKPRYKGFICTQAHPEGCYKNVEDMVNAALGAKPSEKGPINTLVIGASSGYGLASRIVSAFSYKSRTVGVSLERAGTDSRTGSAGFYNNRAFDILSEKHGLSNVTVDGDAFSNTTKQNVISACKDLFGGEKLGLLVYSLASPRRTDSLTQQVYSSVIKPIGETYRNKTVDFHSGAVSDITIEPASKAEIENTIKVMGGEDWSMWIDALKAADLMSDGFITVAYSYIGPELTHAIYKNGTIGRAKDDLLSHCGSINEKLSEYVARAFVSVNKAVVTQASSAIPVVPLYISLLYKIMKAKGLHESCFEQIARLFAQRLYCPGGPLSAEDDRIRIDDLEMRPDVQSEIEKRWAMITSENVEELTDLAGYRSEFASLFGFGREDVDYEQDISLKDYL